MSPKLDAAIDLERFELRLFPKDPPPSCDLQAAEGALQYDLSAPAPNPAIVRIVERFGLPQRPLVATRVEGDEDRDEYQVLHGGAWIRAAREAGLERIPVRAIELPDVQAAFLALVLNQAQAADVAAQADALQALLEAGVDEENLARASGLGRARLRRLRSLLELHPVLRQALREGCVRPQIALGAAQLSPTSQAELAELYLQEGELSAADLRRVGGPAGPSAAPEPSLAPESPPPEPPALDGAGLDDLGLSEAGAADVDGGPPRALAAVGEAAAGGDGTARARRQAEELLRTLERAGAPADIRRRVVEVIEELRAAEI
jgi:ParB-like chromosome segregation protein Spo0J